MAEHKRVAIVGGGLVGALQACFLAKRGYQVDLYEQRDDIRKASAVKGRSINLALSCRGIEALKFVGQEHLVTSTGIPMHARMIHDKQGNRKPIPYGKKDQYIMSVDRRLLNEVLLTACEKYPNVNIHFEHKLSGCDLDKPSLSFSGEGGEEKSYDTDLIIGCDGAYSSVRRHLMKKVRFDFSQEYIPHGYLELRMPPTKDGQFPMEKNYLHIWPRNEFMLIGLPNTEDTSFVLTLFMPFAIFDTIKTRQDVFDFFEEQFPDAIPLIGREDLVQQFFRNKALPMVSVKCSPYYYDDKCVIMGDAAHAMVPFYGQGMNCGFEDCLVFEEMMQRHCGNLTRALPDYSVHRNPDAKAMCDLAMFNYVEMRKSVNSKLFLLRKKIDNLLYVLFPRTWTPLYTMVSFTRTRYHQAIANREWQDRVLSRLMSTVGMATVVCGGLLAANWAKSNYDLTLKELNLETLTLGWWKQ